METSLIIGLLGGIWTMLCFIYIALRDIYKELKKQHNGNTIQKSNF